VLNYQALHGESACSRRSDWLTSRVGGHKIPVEWLPDEAFDRNGDGLVSLALADHQVCVEDLSENDARGAQSGKLAVAIRRCFN
jgi:hypothetical protein